MKKIFLTVIVCFPFLLFSQNQNDTIIREQITFTKEVKKSPSSNDFFEYCDSDSDGFMEIDLNVIINSVLSANANQFGIEEGIYISTSGTTIRLVTDIDTSPIIADVCTTMSGLFDIAVSENNEYYVAKDNLVIKLNSLCDVETYYSFNINSSINALSFDRLNNLYMGGFDSKVYRLNNGNYSQMEMWHDFGSGKSGGDFVMYNDKMYIAWNFDERYKLLEVTVDANNNYISHNDLGRIPNQTFGLASELGNLYGITPGELYKINIPDLSIQTVLVNTNNVNWYGAAGKNEAVNFITNAYESLLDAQNNQNELPTFWTNTIAGGQTIYVSITETLNNQTIIIPVNIVVNLAPTYTIPDTISHCSSSINPYEFNIRATESEILGNQTNVSVNYYNSQSDANNEINPLADNITIDSNTKIIYVKLVNTLSNCSSTFSFNLQVENNPILNQPEDLVFCNGENSINIPLLLSNQTNTILGNQPNLLYLVTYHNSNADAEIGLNPLQNNYLLTSSTKDIYIRIENLDSGCFSTGNFNATVLQESINNINSNFTLNNSDWTVNSNTIQVNIDDLDSYIFSIDGITYQSENYFNNLLPGEYDVHVKNIKTCVINIESVLILMYPNFFTPNNDGANDYWLIKDSFKEKDLQISIFDRYGKLIKLLKNDEIGWDGTYKNQPLPATDYWFTVTRKNGKIYKGHFSLKR